MLFPEATANGAELCSWVMRQVPSSGHAAYAYWIVEVLVGTGTVAVKRYRKTVDAKLGYKPFLNIFILIYLRIKHLHKCLKRGVAVSSLLIPPCVEHSRYYQCPGSPPIVSRRANIPEGICVVAAWRFSRRCSMEDVPGISRIFGDR